MHEYFDDIVFEWDPEEVLALLNEIRCDLKYLECHFYFIHCSHDDANVKNKNKDPKDTVDEIIVSLLGELVYLLFFFFISSVWVIGVKIWPFLI